MRAVKYSVTGEPDVLTLVDGPVPDPGPGEVRVLIHRSGVNPTDWKSRRGSEVGTAVDPPAAPHRSTPSCQPATSCCCRMWPRSTSAPVSACLS